MDKKWLKIQTFFESFDSSKTPESDVLSIIQQWKNELQKSSDAFAQNIHLTLKILLCFLERCILTDASVTLLFSAISLLQPYVSYAKLFVMDVNNRSVANKDVLQTFNFIYKKYFSLLSQLSPLLIANSQLSNESKVWCIEAMISLLTISTSSLRNENSLLNTTRKLLVQIALYYGNCSDLSKENDGNFIAARTPENFESEYLDLFLRNSKELAMEHSNALAQALQLLEPNSEKFSCKNNSDPSAAADPNRSIEIQIVLLRFYCQHVLLVLSHPFWLSVTKHQTKTMDLVKDFSQLTRDFLALKDRYPKFMDLMSVKIFIFRELSTFDSKIEPDFTTKNIPERPVVKSHEITSTNLSVHEQATGSSSRRNIGLKRPKVFPNCKPKDLDTVATEKVSCPNLNAATSSSSFTSTDRISSGSKKSFSMTQDCNFQRSIILPDQNLPSIADTIIIEDQNCPSDAGGCKLNSPQGKQINSHHKLSPSCSEIKPVTPPPNLPLEPCIEEFNQVLHAAFLTTGRFMPALEMLTALNKFFTVIARLHATSLSLLFRNIANLWLEAVSTHGPNCAYYHFLGVCILEKASMSNMISDVYETLNNSEIYQLIFFNWSCKSSFTRALDLEKKWNTSLSIIIKLLRYATGDDLFTSGTSASFDDVYLTVLMDFIESYVKTRLLMDGQIAPSMKIKIERMLEEFFGRARLGSLSMCSLDNSSLFRLGVLISYDIALEDMMKDPNLILYMARYNPCHFEKYLRQIIKVDTPLNEPKTYWIFLATLVAHTVTNSDTLIRALPPPWRNRLKSILESKAYVPLVNSQVFTLITLKPTSWYRDYRHSLIKHVEYHHLR